MHIQLFKYLMPFHIYNYKFSQLKISNASHPSYVYENPIETFCQARCNSYIVTCSNNTPTLVFASFNEAIQANRNKRFEFDLQNHRLLLHSIAVYR